MHGAMMVEDLDETAAIYALGLARGQGRAAIEARMEREPALAAKIVRWQKRLSELDLSAPRLTPPPGLFDKILEAVDEGEERLPGTLTKRAGTGVWTELAPGVMCTILCEDPCAKRRSMLIRAEPGAIYDSHGHDAGYEECLVLEGDLIMGDLTLHAGDFHLATKGSAHPQATTRSGVLVYLSTAI